LLPAEIENQKAERDEKKSGERYLRLNEEKRVDTLKELQDLHLSSLQFP
jgi:hypothetical protein